MIKCIGMFMLIVILAVGVVGAENKTKITVKIMPPSVVKTVPRAGDTKVDPALKEITVTFSKDMMTKNMWAWCSQSPETFPKTGKNIRYLKDKRTCVLPVKLEPGKTYVIGINSRISNSFRDTGNNPAVPYLLVFQTMNKVTSALKHSAEKAAVSAAKSWLTLIDNGKYKESWNETAEAFKAAVSKNKWEKIIQKVRKPLGKNISRKLISKSYHTSPEPSLPKGKYVMIRFNSSFKNKKSAIETITPMMDKDGKWRVVGYYIK
jgi:Protein of unknown function (DUF4019)/Bacterial Ig-like domain